MTPAELKSEISKAVDNPPESLLPEILNHIITLQNQSSNKKI
jgi:hypothetical protein